MAVIIDGDTGIDKITDGSIVAADIGAGEITDAKLASGIDAAKLTGTLPALDASSLTGIPAPAATILPSVILSMPVSPLIITAIIVSPKLVLDILEKYS